MPGRGDSRYRFCLHGAAILSTKPHNGEDVFNTLQEIYDKRSGAAHGSNASADEKIAIDSRRLLAKAIHTIVDLIQDKKLNFSQVNGKIAKAVERYVRFKVTSCSQ